MSKNLSATIVGYEYTPSTPSSLVQGVKYNRRPKGALHGGNGSFIVMGDSPKIIISVKLWNDKTISKNIYGTVKYNSSRSRITEKYADKIADKLLGTVIKIPDYALSPMESFNAAFDSLVKNVVMQTN